MSKDRVQKKGGEANRVVFLDVLWNQGAGSRVNHTRGSKTLSSKGIILDASLGINLQRQGLALFLKKKKREKKKGKGVS